MTAQNILPRRAEPANGAPSLFFSIHGRSEPAF